MVKRRDVPVWVFPGGGVEPSERPEAAAIRETEEESGYKVKVKRLVGIYKKQNADLGYVFECVLLGGKARTSNESSAVDFFSVNKLPELIPPTVQVWIRDALRNLKVPVEEDFPRIETKKIILQNILRHPNIVLRYLLVAYFGIHLN